MSRLHVFQVQDQQVSLRVDGPDLYPLAEGLYSACCVSREPCVASAAADLAWEKSLLASSRYRISLDGKPLEEGLEPVDLFFQTEHLLNQLFYRKLAHFFQLHAAAVVDPDGRGWLICGPSQSGKTSLTLALMLERWGWLSDEMVMLSESEPTRMLGFPRNFNLKQDSFHRFPETAGLPHTRELFSTYRNMRVRFFDPNDLAPGAWRNEAPLAGILFPRFDPEATSARFTPQGGIAMAEGLLAEITCWQPWGVPFLSRVCQTIPGYEVRFNNPRDISQALAAAQFL